MVALCGCILNIGTVVDILGRRLEDLRVTTDQQLHTTQGRHKILVTHMSNFWTLPDTPNAFPYGATYDCRKHSIDYNISRIADLAPIELCNKILLSLDPSRLPTTATTSVCAEISRRCFDVVQHTVAASLTCSEIYWKSPIFFQICCSCGISHGPPTSKLHSQQSHANIRCRVAMVAATRSNQLRLEGAKRLNRLPVA